MNRGAAALLAVVVAGTAPAGAVAQTDASLGLGIGTVRYETGASLGSVAVSPALHAAGSAFAVDLGGAVASIPGAVWATQGRADLWAATPPLTDGLRVGAEAILAGTARTDSGWTSAVHALGELLWSAPRWGVGVGAGPSTGWISGTPVSSVTALHTRLRLWWRPGGDAGGTDWQLAVEPTRFAGSWFTDLGAGVTLTRNTTILSLAASTRVFSTYAYSAGSAFLQHYVSRSVSLELGGGSYLRDPYQGLPRAGFLTLGVRLHSAPRAARAAPAAQWAPLVPLHRGDTLVVRFRMEGARSVAIAGDWNAWQPAPLRPVGDEVWEGTLGLARGLYHFNLLVDGNDWVVPNGVATVSDGLGGMVAVLVVP